MSTGFFTFAMSLLLSFSALAAPLEINTHTAAVPEQSFQIAKTWFLPDWQAGSTSRTDKAPSGSGDRQDLACSTYGGCANIPTNTTCSQTFSAKGTTCYKSCSCKSGYNQVSNADICRGCANPCADVSAVATPYGCKTAWSVCPSKCQVAYPDNCHNRTAVPTPYGCKTYFSDCSSKCEVAYPDNCLNRTAVSAPHGCKSYFSDCPSKCQVAYSDNCHIRIAVATPYGCKTYFSDCSSKCQTAYSNNCSNRTAVATPYGCKTYFSDCSSKCQKAYSDNCSNRTAVATPYGCETYFSDCSSKCEVAYSDNCRNRTAVATPYGCKTYFSDCSSKCQVAYSDNCRNQTTKPLATSCANGCAKDETVSDCNSRCAIGCKAKCNTGYRLSSDETSCVEIPCESCFQSEPCGTNYTIDLIQDSNPKCHTCKLSTNLSGIVLCRTLNGVCRIGCGAAETKLGKCAGNTYCCIPKDTSACQCSDYKNPTCTDGQTKTYNPCNSKLWKCDGEACLNGYSTGLNSCAQGYILKAQSNNPSCKTCVFGCESGYSTNVSCPAGYRAVASGSNPNCKKCECYDANICPCSSNGGICVSSCSSGYQKVGRCGTTSNVCCIRL